jgi:hypothetical protein
MNPVLPLLVAIVTLSGCAATENQLYSGFAARQLSDDGALEPYGKLVKTLVRDKDSAVGWVDAACFASPVADKDRSACAIARNQTVAVLAVASSDLCVKHRQSIYGREATLNVTLGSLTNLFAGAAAVARSEAAKTLYAALALFSNSERSLVNETVYKTMIVTAVDQKIVETMETRAQALDQSQTKSIDEFGMHQALRQVIELHNACSFMNGLRLALAEGTRGSNARKVLVLRQNLATVGSEMARACGTATPPTATVGAGTVATPPSTASSVRCEAAKQRFQAVSTALQAAETAVE